MAARPSANGGFGPRFPIGEEDDDSRRYVPDDVAKAVLFLASRDGSYVTETELFVDGGYAQV
jgi:NAD(P)-dependent dehydrogenase (short-subunit alcohol dehydrogenase family)